MGGSRLVNITATGDITAAGVNGEVYSITLAAGSDTATAVVRDGGSGGTIIAKLSAVANTQATYTLVKGHHYTNGLHATLTGTSPSFTAEI
jgi:hypothetical protein